MHREMNNKELATLFRAITAALEVKGKNQFQIKAYDEAASAIEHSTSEVKDLWDDGKLEEIPGVGKSLASHLDELFRKGNVRHFEQVMKGLPPTMFELLDIPGIGAKTAYRLCKELKLKDPKTVIGDLSKAAKEGKIAPIESFGEKSQADILEALEEFKKGQIKKKRMPLPYADAISQEIIAYLQKCPLTIQADSLGSLKRRVATVGDIDIAVATKKPAEVIEWFIAYPKKKKIIEKGPTGGSILLKSGQQVDLRVQKPQAYGSMLQYFIGSKHHNIHLRELALKKGLSLSEYGIKKGKKLTEYATEEEFYQALGMPWIPPEIREDTGEIEAAQAGKLPKLVELKEIKGDLHIHSDFPIEPSHDEGGDSIATLMTKGKKLGYEYLGLAEHNPSLSQHNQKQIISILKRKKEEVDKINYSRGRKLLINIFNGLEIDIKPDGNLAIPEEGFKYLDFAIASVHSSFKMSRKQMTKRILSSIQHPKIKIIGHPTGRMLGVREGYELDWLEVFSFCKKKGVWLEINAWPNRLDLTDILVKDAVKNGVKMIIGTDSHQVDQMDLMEYGVAVARRGWATRNDIINTMSYNQFMKALKGGE